MVNVTTWQKREMATQKKSDRKGQEGGRVDDGAKKRGGTSEWGGRVKERCRYLREGRKRKVSDSLSSSAKNG